MSGHDDATPIDREQHAQSGFGSSLRNVLALIIKQACRTGCKIIMI